ncbi:biopolymer transport protein ExbB [Phycisphaerae bacterium RAS2]|nr:biopolymer transport protein ExbB [Phycisphaerae bacterium RAS2]
MNQSRWIGVALFGAAAIASTASGQDVVNGGPAPQATSGSRTLFTVIVHGAEWTGLIIAVMSLATVTIIIEQFVSVRRKTMAPESAIEQMRALIDARKFKDCIEQLKAQRSMFADVLEVGLRHGRHGFDAMRECADERAGVWSSRLFRRVEYLNVIGNLAPLLGLLGTVLGMIKAFGAMQDTHGAYRPEDLAGGISLALVNTFLGLSVAIVALGFFGICRNRVDALTVSAHAAVLDLLEYFRPATVGFGTDAPRPATPTPGGAAGSLPGSAAGSAGAASARPQPVESR